MIGRLEILPDTHRAVWIDRPREIDPELVFLPHFAGVRLIRVLELLARSLSQHPIHRLAKTDPLASVGFLAHQVVAFGAESHGQHIVGEPGSLAPRGSERGMQAKLLLVPQHLNPGKTPGKSTPD